MNVGSQRDKHHLQGAGQGVGSGPWDWSQKEHDGTQGTLPQLQAKNSQVPEAAESGC